MPADSASEGRVAKQIIPEYSVHLDAIRGGAAAIVFLAHLHLFFLPSPRKQASTAVASVSPASEPGHRQAAGHADYAHQAVMVFFVLSGFLVGGSVFRVIRRHSWSWRRYILHRMVRLWMVLIPALFLGLLLDSTGSRIFSGQGTIYSAPAGQNIILPDLASRLGPTIFLGNMAFLQEILVTPLGTNQPLWSLTNEFWYYMAFPLLVFALLSRLPLLWRLASAALIGGIFFFTGWKIAIYFAIWLMGVLAAILPEKLPSKYRRGFVIVSLMLFFAVNVLARYKSSNGYMVDLLIGAVSFVLLYSVAQLKGPSSPGLYRSGARFASRISYSLYLTHGPLLCFLSALLVGRWTTLAMNAHTLLILAEVTAIALLIACAMHFLFEARTDQVRKYLEAKMERQQVEVV